MKNLIEVVKRAKPRVKGALIDEEPEHFVDVKISGPIIEALRTGRSLAWTVFRTVERDHEANIASEGTRFNRHKRLEPDCSYCGLVDEAEAAFALVAKVLRAIEGKAL